MTMGSAGRAAHPTPGTSMCGRCHGGLLAIGHSAMVSDRDLAVLVKPDSVDCPIKVRLFRSSRGSTDSATRPFRISAPKRSAGYSLSMVAGFRRAHAPCSATTDSLRAASSCEVLASSTYFAPAASTTRRAVWSSDTFALRRRCSMADRRRSDCCIHRLSSPVWRSCLLRPVHC